MATQHAAAAIETSHRKGMIKRLSVISMSFLERILKTAGPNDHDQWPVEPTIGPINPGMLTKIAQDASTEYLHIMTTNGRDALAEFDGRLLRQVIKNVIFETLSVSRKSRRATSPHNAMMMMMANNSSAANDAMTSSSSPGITPRDYTHTSPSGIPTIPLHSPTSSSSYAAAVAGRFSTTSPLSSTRSAMGSSRFMALHPAKAEAMIATKRMLDPLMQTSKFPREAYKAVVMDVGDQFMERYHPNEQFHHVFRGTASNGNQNDFDENGIPRPNHQQSSPSSSPDSYTLQTNEREWITATVLAAISRISVNEDGSIVVNGRVVAYAPHGTAGFSPSSRGESQQPFGRGVGNNHNNNDGSFLKQLQRLRNILAQEENDTNNGNSSNSYSSSVNHNSQPSLSVDDPEHGRVTASVSSSPYRSPTFNSSGGGNNNQQSQPPVEKSFKERVYCILAKYAPNRIDRVDKYMEQYKGQEADLIQALTDKYGPEPIGDAPVEIDVPFVAAAVSSPSQNRGSSIGGGSSRRDELERMISNMQQQMNQMQSQVMAAQKELTLIRESEEREEQQSPEQRHEGDEVSTEQ